MFSIGVYREGGLWTREDGKTGGRSLTFRIWLLSGESWDDETRELLSFSDKIYIRRCIFEQMEVLRFSVASLFDGNREWRQSSDQKTRSELNFYGFQASAILHSSLEPAYARLPGHCDERRSKSK